MSGNTPVETNDAIRHALGYMAAMRSAIRCGESWSDEEFGSVQKVMDRLEAAQSERDQLAAHVERLRAALEGLREEVSAGCHPDAPVEELKDGIHFEPVVEADRVLALTPPAALDELRRKLIGEESDRWITAIRKIDLGLCDFIDEGDIAARLAEWLEALRRRERSIGAEEELRQIADLIETEVLDERIAALFCADLRDRADAIAAERDHIADVGKKVEGGAA